MSQKTLFIFNKCAYVRECMWTYTQYSNSYIRNEEYNNKNNENHDKLHTKEGCFCCRPREPKFPLQTALRLSL